jgi:hypothetical protein
MKKRGMIARSARIISGANPILSLFESRVPSRSRAPAKVAKGSDGGALQRRLA